MMCLVGGVAVLGTSLSLPVICINVPSTVTILISIFCPVYQKSISSSAVKPMGIVMRPFVGFLSG